MTDCSEPFDSSFSRKRFIILDVCKMTLERAKKELSAERIEMLKDSIYVHQVLAVPFFIIRREPFGRRCSLLRDYMIKVDQMFPDFHENREIHEYGTWGGNRLINAYRKLSLWLIKHKHYMVLNIIWTFVKPFIKE